MATKDDLWVAYWSKHLRRGADPKVILRQIRQFAKYGKVFEPGYNPFKEELRVQGR